jgi:hypothetical protein
LIWPLLSNFSLLDSGMSAFEPTPVLFPRPETIRPQASFWHFFMKLFRAASAKDLPSLLTAFGSHASFLHFLTKAVFAAPASGLLSLPTLASRRPSAQSPKR